MLHICLVFWESEPQYAYKRYAYKKNATNGLEKNLFKKHFIGQKLKYSRFINACRISRKSTFANRHFLGVKNGI